MVKSRCEHELRIVENLDSVPRRTIVSLRLRMLLRTSPALRPRLRTTLQSSHPMIGAQTKLACQVRHAAVHTHTTLQRLRAPGSDLVPC